MKHHICLVLLLVLVTAFGCKKDDKKKTINDFTIEALTNGKWKSVLTDNDTSTNPKSGNNSYWPVPTCRQDDLYTYTSNGEALTDNNKTVCTEDEPAAKQSYTIDLSNKKITVNGVTYNILELSSTRFKLSRVIPGTSGVSNLIYVFQHP